jgi:hypothetical protein
VGAIYDSSVSYHALEGQQTKRMLKSMEDDAACPLKLASGVPCVTCGITRVSVDLAHGEVLDALALAPLPTLALLFCLGLGTAALVAWIRRRRGPDRLVLWLLITTPGRATLGVLVLGLYAWTLVRFTATGLP